MKYYKVFETYIGLAGEEEELWHITTEKPYDGGVKRSWSRKQETTIEEPIPARFEELTEEEALVEAIETYTEFEDDNTRRQTIQFQHSILDMLEEIEFFFEHFDKNLIGFVGFFRFTLHRNHVLTEIAANIPTVTFVTISHFLASKKLGINVWAETPEIKDALGEFIEVTADDNDVPCEVAK